MKSPFIRTFGVRSRQAGQGMTEYIIIVALIAIAAIAAFTYFGGDVRAQVGGMANELAGKSASQDIQRAGSVAGKARQEGQKTKTLSSYNNS